LGDSPHGDWYRKRKRTASHLSTVLFLSVLTIATIFVNASPTVALSITGASSSINGKGRIRAISLDVTGTLVATREPVVQSYHDALLWAEFPNPPTREDMKAAFKTAYKERCMESPCFGGVQGIAGRDWWRETVKRVLVHSGRSPHSEFSDEDFDRYFRRVYQHFGSCQGYLVLDDAQALLDSLHRKAKEDRDGAIILLGITSNTPTRHMETVLPMLGIHDQFRWFTCSQEVGAEKPSPEIFEDAYRKAKFWIPDLQKHQVLHIGDSLACDFCGARAFGF
jgi:REG-2-like HAD superfamily hydrolase